VQSPAKRFKLKNIDFKVRKYELLKEKYMEIQ